MPRVHVVQGKDLWEVSLDGALLAVFAAKTTAIRFSLKMADQRRDELVIHYSDGSIEDGRDFLGTDENGDEVSSESAPVEGRDEHRRSLRVRRSIPLALTKGSATLEASTADISRHGALVLTATPWSPGATFVALNQTNETTARGRVVWSGEGDEPGQFKLGLEFLSVAESFWGSEYQM